MNKTVSASKCKTALLCMRRSSYERLFGSEDTPQTLFGDGAHDQCEHWIEDGTPPDPETPEGRALLAALPHIPMPGAAVAERPFRFNHDGVTYSGRTDWLTGYVPGLVIVVGDLKTTGNLRWRKKPDQLYWDPQAIIYPKWAKDTFRTRFVAVNWVYTQRDGKRSEPTQFVLEAGTIDAKFEALHQRIGLPIWNTYGQPPELAPRNLDSCNAFGRPCPFKQQCWADLSPLETI